LGKSVTNFNSCAFENALVRGAENEAECPSKKQALQQPEWQNALVPA
jgi:hypothetical protein